MAADAATGKRPRSTAPVTVVVVQQGLVPGRPAGEYREPDHSVGEAAWPGRQAPTRQLSLFDATFQKRLNAEEQRRIDAAPSSPTQTRVVVQRRLTSYSGFVCFSSSSNSHTDETSCSSDADADADAD